MTNSNTLLTRRVDKVLPSKEALEKLMGKRKIKLYQGFDPTGTRLHLGHSIGLRKLMEFSNAGHEVIFLFGTGTVLAGGGDPSDRDTGRKMITQEEIDANIKDWKKQVSPLVDWSKITIKQNGDWLIPLTLKEILEIANNISAIQLFKREMFQRRLQHGDTVWLSETLYPLLQGYDSVAMDVDLEIGGTDQEFNMLVGRELMKKMKNKEKFVLTTPMILGTDGKQMSKTTGNCIWLDDTPEDMFGKIMSLPDSQILSYWQLLTDLPLEDLTDLDQNPLDHKKRLAEDITRQFHGPDKAHEAADHFHRTVQQKETPDEVEEFSIDRGEHTYLDIIKQANTNLSNSEIKRLAAQGGIKWNGQSITHLNEKFDVGGGEILQVGKRLFRKAKVD